MQNQNAATGVTTADGAEKEGRAPLLGRSRGVRIGPDMARAALQHVAREITTTTGAGSDGTWKTTGSTAHQWVKPDMGRLVLETALRGGRIAGGATRTKKKKSGNTAPHLERFWTQLILSTARTVLGNVELKGRNTGGAKSPQK